MKKLVLLFVLIVSVLEINAQTYSFSLKDDSNNYKLEINVSKNTITVYKSGSLWFVSIFYAVGTDEVKDKLFFSFYKDEDPLEDIVNTIINGNKQCMCLYLNNNKIDFNNPNALNEPYTLSPVSSYDYSNTFNNLMDFIVEDLEIDRNKVGQYKSDAELGDLYAQCQYGKCLLEGIGVRKDETSAASWFKKAADNGYVHGMRYLGVCYRDGKGVNKNTLEAKKWFKRAGTWGNPDAQYNYGLLCDDKKVAFEWFLKAANQGGHELAFTSVAQCYQYALGVSKNLPKACEYLQKAVDKGNASAMHQLAINYINGDGVRLDYSRAKSLLYDAAAKKYVLSQRQLGILFLEGLAGVAKDEKEAVRWLQMAADADDTEAQKYLGVCYWKGLGVKKNKDSARYWLKKASAKGDNEARRLLDKI